MNSRSNHYKTFRDGVGSNPTEAKAPLSSLLENALNNSLRKKYGFNVLFADLKKAPKREWTKWQSQAQTDDDVRSLFSSWKPGEASCWGFVCGYKGLEGLDFDWACFYRLWKVRFGERADTLTVQTPNGGLRPFYTCEKPETHDEFKESLHMELKGLGRFVVHEGKVSREDGSIGEYKIVNDKPIRRDDSIAADTLAFLQETYSRYSFLWWNCLRPYFKKKVLGEPSHELRLFLSDIMACDGFSDDEIHNLFRDFADYDYRKTQDQVDYTRQRVKAGLKPPTCETLRQNLGWSEENCRGCTRKGEVKHEEGIPLGDYRLELKGSNAVVFDEKGEPVWATKATSLAGLQTKRNLAKKLELKEDVVDRAVAKLIVQMETKRPKPETETGPAPTELVEKAISLLKDPKLLLIIIKALRGLGLIGETRNALDCFFDMLSTLTDNPINRRWSGRSGIGKTTIVVKVASLFPPEMVMMLSGATKKTLWYHPDVVEIDETTRELNLEGKIIILLEESESQEFLDEIKPLLSHDKYELEYAFVEKVNGLNITHKMRLKGWPAYIGITTEPELREEQQTRALLATPDRGREKWRAVIVADAEASVKLETEEHNSLVAVIQEVIRQLKRVKVWTPWLPVVAHLFPHEDAKSMREWRFFHSFLDSIALLHQQQLIKIRLSSEERLAAPVSILEVASKIAEASLAETIFKLPRDVQEFINHLGQGKEKEWPYKNLQREYSKCFGGSIPLTTLKRRYVEKLVDEGLLEVDDSKKPYKIKFLENRSTTLTIFEKALKIIRSGKINGELIQKRSSTTDTRVQQLSAFDPNGKPVPISQLTTTLCSAHVVDDLLKAISRSKEEEYCVSDSFSELVKVVDSFSEEKPQTTLIQPEAAPLSDPAAIEQTMENTMQNQHGTTRTTSGAISVVSEGKAAVLTQDNIEKVLNALIEASKVRGSATTHEIALEAGLPDEPVEALLKQLEREGKVYSSYPSWWKMA